MEPPRIRRVPLVRGRTVVLRDVEEADAAFILSLRLDAQRNRFLSPVSADVERQRAWIRDYRACEGQAYFIVCDLALAPLGTVRLYDAQGDSFSWGSWILKPGVPPAAAVESAMLVYRLALSWGFQASHFQVRHGNTSVLKFHRRWGAEVTREDAVETHLRLDRAAIEAGLRRFERLLPREGAA